MNRAQAGRTLWTPARAIGPVTFLVVVTSTSSSRLAQDVAAACSARRLQLATAESCTGGLLAKLLTDVPGSSAWFERGVVTYSNRAKQDLLGVSAAVLQAEGAVSQACAAAMAEGLLARAPVDWTVALTGIAGPGGGSADKPVGLVWIAWARRGSSAQAVHHLFAGEREAVREQAARAALKGLLDRLEREAGTTA